MEKQGYQEEAGPKHQRKLIRESDESFTVTVRKSIDANAMRKIPDETAENLDTEEAQATVAKLLDKY